MRVPLPPKPKPDKALLARQQANRDKNYIGQTRSEQAMIKRAPAGLQTAAQTKRNIKVATAVKQTAKVNVAQRNTAKPPSSVATKGPRPVKPAAGISQPMARANQTPNIAQKQKINRGQAGKVGTVRVAKPVTPVPRSEKNSIGQAVGEQAQISRVQGQEQKAKMERRLKTAAKPAYGKPGSFAPVGPLRERKIQSPLDPAFGVGKAKRKPAMPGGLDPQFGVSVKKIAARRAKGSMAKRKFF